MVGGRVEASVGEDGDVAVVAGLRVGVAGGEALVMLEERGGEVVLEDGGGDGEAAAVGLVAQVGDRALEVRVGGLAVVGDGDALERRVGVEGGDARDVAVGGDDDAVAVVELGADVEVLVAGGDEAAGEERDVAVLAVDALRDGAGEVLAQGVSDEGDGSALRPCCCRRRCRRRCSGPATGPVLLGRRCRRRWRAGCRARRTV